MKLRLTSLLCIASLLIAAHASAGTSAQAITYQLDQGIAYLPAEGTAVSSYAKEKCRLDLYRPNPA